MNQQVLAEKKDVVKNINSVLKSSHSAVVVTYTGLSVKEITSLRNDLKKEGAKMSVYKNTLLKKAVDEDGLGELDSLLTGPIALVTSQGEGNGLQLLLNYELTHKKFAIKGGMIDGVFCDEEKLKYLASVGNKENAISVFLSTLLSPLSQFAIALKAVADKCGQNA